MGKGVRPETKKERRKRLKLKLTQTHEEERMATKSVREKHTAEAKDNTASENRNLQSCESRMHRGLDRGGEGDGTRLLPVVSPNFNSHFALAA